MKPRVEALLRTIEHLGDPLGAINSSDEMRFATLLVAEISEAIATQVEGLVKHPNVHARRVAVQAVCSKYCRGS